MELDKDLQARQEARLLAKQAHAAQQQLSRWSQEQLDGIVQAMAEAFCREAEALAELAVQETGFGNIRDKTEKNRFASRDVARAVKDMKTVGLLSKEPEGGLWQIGVPKGPIAAIVPSTNPTSTICYKAIISIKSGNAIVFSPHPNAAGCTLRASQLLARAAETAGAPEGCISCLTKASLAGCRELMDAPQIRLILATGGPGMVRAAYSSGKPAIGVGAGNGPAYIHQSADMKKALEDIARSKSFDNGTICASEQSIIVEQPREQVLRDTATALGYHFMDTREAGLLAKLLFRCDGSPDPGTVGKSARELAEKAGFQVPAGTRILVAREQEAGPTRPYSMEKLCPVLALFVMESEDAVLEKAIEVLTHEGSGHTFVIHAQDREVIRKFALQVPVSRFLVNTPGALGGIGATTALFPALTLGCGSAGGSSSSNNISPMDLVDIRRVAWGTEKSPAPGEAPDLVELLTEKILQRLGK